jgi:hypothetical protein
VRILLWPAGLVAISLFMQFVAWPRYFAPNNFSYDLAWLFVIVGFSLAIWTGPAVNKMLDTERGDSRSMFTVATVVLFGAMASVFYFGVTTTWQGTSYNLGTLGDFMGGTLNPILTFLTFAGLLFTIILQQRELHLANEAKKKADESLGEEKKRVARQQFEYTFFQMIGLYNNIVNALDIYFRPSEQGESAGHEVKGRDCFKTYLGNYYDKYRPLGEFENEKERLDKSYKAFWEKRQQDLSHYFRYLYNVLRFVFEYEDDIGDRFKYIKLLRAQLSDFELLVLFYTALHENGKNYVRYIEEYALFDNLPYEHVLSKKHLKMYSRKCYGSQADAVMAYADSLPDPGDF